MFKRNVILTVSLVILFSGCASTKPKPSGFLADYSHLEAVKYHRKRLIAKHEQKSLADYSKFIVDPVVIQLQPKSKAQKLGDEKLEKLADEFYNNIKNALAENYQLVEVPGEGVLVIRTALTDVITTSILLNLHASSAILLGPGVGGASIESEFVDSLTGEQIMAVMETKKGKTYKYHKGFSRLAHSEDVLKQWATWMVEQIDEAHALK